MLYIFSILNCGAATLKTVAYSFEMGQSKIEGGCSAAVCRFGTDVRIHYHQDSNKVTVYIADDKHWTCMCSVAIVRSKCDVWP